MPEQPVRYLSAKEAAKLIRADLKRLCPKAIFYVRMKRLTWHAGINIDWCGPYTEAQVREVVNKYQGADYNLHNDDGTDWREPVVIDGVLTKSDVVSISLHRQRYTGLIDA